MRVGAKTDRLLRRWDERNQRALEATIEPVSFEGPGIVVFAQTWSDASRYQIAFLHFPFQYSIDGGERNRGTFGWSFYPLPFGRHTVDFFDRPGLFPTLRNGAVFTLEQDRPIVKLHYVTPRLFGGSVTVSSVPKAHGTSND